jgi:regulator of nonsense transcripts 3
VIFSKPHETDYSNSSWRCWVRPTALIIFSHHFAHRVLVAFTERPAMPTSTPLFDALEAERSTQRNKEVIQRNNPYYSDATQASKKGESKKKAGAASNASWVAKQGGDPTAPLGERAAKSAATVATAQKEPAQSCSTTQPNRKRIRCSLCGQALSE